jgi:hypothetical protein
MTDVQYVGGPFVLLNAKGFLNFTVFFKGFSLIRLACVCEIKVKDKTHPALLQHVKKESKGVQVNFALDS